MFAKIALMFLIAISFNMSAFAYGDADYISAVEMNMFATKFTSENIESRLGRIEKNIFGSVSKLSRQQRIQKVRNAIGNIVTYQHTVLANKSVKPVKTIVNSNNHKKLILNKPEIKTPILADIGYPIIDMLENKVLNRTFSTEDIYKRLSRLEVIVFKQSMQDSLDERVGRLKSVILGEALQPSNDTYGSNSRFDAESAKSIITKLEQDTFNSVYLNDPIESRLSRLEMKMFNQDSPDDSVDDRVERLSTVIAAQPSNELYRDMSKMRQYQQVGTGITAATLVLLILKALLF